MTVQSVARDVFAGTCGGVALTMVGHPFDTVKVRLGTRPVDKPVYSYVVNCIKNAIKSEGVPGLYKGVASPLVSQMAIRGSLFGAFGSAKRWLATNPDGTTRTLTTSDFYRAGLITGFVAAFIEGPIDFYKSQTQAHFFRIKTDPTYKSPYANMFDCTKATIRQSGIRGPYQALGPTIIRNTLANSIALGTFEVLKEDATNRYNCTAPQLPLYVVMTAAGIAGLLYWVTIFPVDVVGSAMASDSIIYSERKCPTMAVTVQKLWAEGGIKRFYKGFKPCLMRGGPENAAMLYTVDRVTNSLS